MLVREILSKSVLNRTAITGYDYCVNPYVGCGHGCRYCYASFMKRFSGHREPWGSFVDVKVNAPEVLERQTKRVKQGSILLGTVTDAYQPLEKKYRVTRGCLEALLGRQFHVNLLTRSPLCLRDMDLFKRLHSLEVGFSIGTDDDKVRKIFEPHSPPIDSRIEALNILYREGVSTYAFIGPMLPLNPPRLVSLLVGKVKEVLIDKMNYAGRVRTLYRRANLEPFLQDSYFRIFGKDLKERFEEAGVSVTMIF